MGFSLESSFVCWSILNLFILIYFLIIKTIFFLISRGLKYIDFIYFTFYSLNWIIKFSFLKKFKPNLIIKIKPKKKILNWLSLCIFKKSCSLYWILRRIFYTKQNIIIKIKYVTYTSILNLRQRK